MQLTKRDLEILCFINDFGFCETRQLGERFGLMAYRVHRIMKRLISQELVIKDKILYGRDAVYCVTSKGASCTNLPRLLKVSVGTYYHSIALVDLYLKIRQIYPDAFWVSERHLRQDCDVTDRKKGHCADAVIEFEDKRIAVELELSLKKQARLEKILKGYSTNFSINEVWYFCDKSVMSLLTRASSKLDYIKVYNFESFLAGDIYLD